MPPKELAKFKLESKRIIKDGHWLFNGGGGRYGLIVVNGKNYSPHRLAAYVYLGLDLDSNKQANHKCEFKKCFNPAHLYIGNQSENINDYIRTQPYRKCGHVR